MHRERLSESSSEVPHRVDLLWHCVGVQHRCSSYPVGESMTLATYVILVQHIEQILHTSMEDRLKIASIQELIRGVRDDEGMLDDSRR